MPLVADAALAEEVLAEWLLGQKAGRTAAAEIERPESPLSWAERHRKIDGQPFSLERFRPLRELYTDSHPHIAVMKPAQRGVSEWAINLTCFALEHGASAWAPEKDGINVGYIFPTKDALGDFSKERLSGLKDESPHLAGLFGVDEFDAVTFKQIGRSYLYLRGGWSESALLSFSADVLVLDEFDRMDPQAVALARRRLNASVVRREVDISTPTLPGKGIHALYLQSDQHVYEQPHACGAWNAYDFHRDVRAGGEPFEVWKHWAPERLRRADVLLVCPSCRAPLSEAERCAEGRWTALAPEVTGIRGYHIPGLCWPFVSLRQLAIAAVSQDPSEVQEFYRSDLGLPYEVSGSRVTEGMLKQLGHRLPGGALPDVAWRQTTMGVDVGSRFHYRVSSLDPDGRVCVRAMGSVGSWDELDRLLEAYKVRHCVVDAFPEQHAAKSWAAKHEGKVLRALYPNQSAMAGELFRVDAEDGRVQINRTMAMDGVYAAVAAGDEDWPARVHNDPEVLAHLTAPVRVVTSDERGQEKASWVHTSPDHLYHACLVAGTRVLTERGEVAIEAVTPGMRVWTRSGLARVTAAGMTAPDAEVVAYRFSNGTVLTATPNHPVYTESNGFIPLHSTVYDDRMLAWQTSKRSPIAALCSGAIPMLVAALTGSISRPAMPTESAVSSASIRRFGRTFTAPFHPIITSITLMAIASTTIRATSSASQPSPTCPSTRKWIIPALSTWLASASCLMPGGGPRKGTPGTASTPGRQSALLPIVNSPVLTASEPSRRSLRKPPTVSGTAPEHASPLSVVRAALTTWIGSARSAAARSVSTASARPAPAQWPAAESSRVRRSGSVPAGSAPVFNISVEGAEEYFANGILVHNCVYDRIARATLPKAELKAFTPGVVSTGWQPKTGRR